MEVENDSKITILNSLEVTPTDKTGHYDAKTGRYIPVIGEKLYLRTYTGHYYVDYVKRPYTVISISPTMLLVREADLVFYGPRYYDTVADEIHDDVNNYVRVLRWSAKNKHWCWKSSPQDRYPLVAVWGEGWQHQPYLD